MLEIRFQGLMTHARVKDGSGKMQQRVVLYNVTHERHVALMTIREKDIVRAPAGDLTGTNVRCYKLRTKTEDKLTKITTSLSKTSLPILHLAGVQSLKGISNGRNAQDAIGMFTPTNDLPVLVDIPDGALLVRNWFKDAADFGSGKPQCVPRTIVFTVNASANVTIHLDSTGGNRDVELFPDSLVYITNLSTATSPSSHFHAKAAFFKDSTDGKAVKVRDPVKNGLCNGVGGADDRFDTCNVGSTLSVECSNSTFP